MILSGSVLAALILCILTVIFIVFILCGAWFFLCWFDQEESRKAKPVKKSRLEKLKDNE